MLSLCLQAAFLLAQVCFSLVLPMDGTLGQAVLQSSVERQNLGGDVKKALVKAGIIPDVLDDFNPAVALSISYVSKDKDVHLGNKIKPKAVQDQPKFSLETIPTRTLNSDATYVLALTDPDATSRSEPVKAQMCHWLVTNITTQTYEFSSEESFGSENSDIMSYYPPAPPPKTGYHRYVFVLMTTTKDIGSIKKPKDRPHWGYGKVGAGVREWAAENEMEVLGANFFYARNKSHTASNDLPEGFTDSRAVDECAIGQRFPYL